MANLSKPEDAVVIGMGCRFPGSATSPSKLWDMLAHKESGWSPITRFNAKGFYHPDPKRQGAIHIDGAHFLQSDPTAFDAPFFSIPAAIARSMDPQQRLLLELTYEALEDAGITMEEIKGSRTSVFIASFVKDYEIIIMRDVDSQPEHSSTGNGTAIMSNRISYVFDLKGPSVTIDTACSGSLVAIDLAIQSLKSGSADMAIVGGVNMILTPDTMLPMTSMGFLSPEGKCFTFDSRASGYGRGEGAGIVILKRASDARIHNDPIRAVVVGHGVNQDGRTSGITMPNPEAQEANIRDVYSKVGINYNDTAYVECHGTGTIVGDKFETSAISNAIQSNRSTRRPLVVGSVKTNIGHLEAAAGVAGFIKAVLTVEKGKILPNINFAAPRQDFSVKDLGLEIPFEVMDWPQGYTKRQVSVNSFGFGGTNAHVVLQDSSDLSLPLTPPPDSTLYSPSSVPQPFVFSARDAPILKRMLTRMAEHIESLPPTIPPSYFEDLAYTMGARRSKLDTRVSISADSLPSLLTSLLEAKEANFVTPPSKSPRICFIFAGQGVVWPQMGDNLRSFKVYRDSIAASNEYFRSTYQWNGDIETIISAPKSESQIFDIHFSQMLSTTIQIACIDLLASLGIQAEYVLGHSSGEIAAAYAAGKVTREFALSCAFWRGISVKTFLAERKEISGGMVSVGMSKEEAQTFLDELKLNPRHIVVACINSPRSVTISGRAAEIAIVAVELKRLNIFHRVLQIPIGYHSPDMGIIENAYSNTLFSSMESGTFFASHEVADAPIMYSSLFGCEMDKAPLDTTYWSQNLVQPVLFNGALKAMMTNGRPQPTVFIEVGTGGGMRTPVLDSVAPFVTGKKKPIYISLLNHKQSSEICIVQKLGDMWSLGLPVNLANVISRSTSQSSLRCLNDLPSYPWDHESKYWYESRLSKSYMARGVPRRDLIGSRSLESTPYDMKWRGFHRLSENPWIREHKIQEALLYPAAGMIAMVIEGGADISSEMQNITAYEITDFVIHQAMVVPDDVTGLESILSMRRARYNDETQWIFEIYSRDSSGPFQRNASGALTLVTGSQSMDSFLSKQSSRIRESFFSCTEETSTIELYETLDSIGLSYGPTFRNITSLWRNGSNTFATLKTPDTKSGMPGGFEFDHVIHPATLDSMLHTLFTPESHPMVPVGIEKIVISASLRGGSVGTPFYGFGQLTSQGVRESHGDLAMTLSLDENPHVVLSGIRLAALRLPENWIRNYRYLGTEVVWKEDISMSRPAQGRTFQDVLSSLVFKKPALSVLKIGWSATQSPLLLAEFARPGMNIVLTLQKHMSCDVDEDALKASGLPYKIIEMFGKEIASSYDLIFACNQEGLNIASLQGRLRTHGVMFLPSSLKLMVPYLTSDHPSVDQSNASSVSCFGVSSTMLRASQNGNIDSPIAILLPHDCAHGVMSLGTAIRSIFLEQGNSATLVEMPLDESSKIEVEGSKCISLLHLTQEEKMWTQPENVSLIKQLKTLASGLFFVTCPSLSNGMYGSQVTGLVRTLVSENSGLTLGTLRLSEGSDFTSAKTVSLIRDAATQVFDGPEVKDIEFEERDSVLLIPRLQLLENINAMLDPTLQVPTEVKFFSSDTQKQPTLYSHKMTGEANNLFWSQSPRPFPGPGEVLLKRQAMLLSAADVQCVKGISSSDSSALGRDFFGFSASSDGSTQVRVVGLIRPQPVSPSVVANNLLVKPVAEGFQYFSLSAYVSAVAAFCAPTPVMEALEQSDLKLILSESTLPIHDKTVLVVGAASVEGQAAVEVAAAYGYIVYCCVADTSEMDTMINSGVPRDRIMISDSQGFSSVKRFDMVYAVAGFSVPTSIKCHTLFELVSAHSQSLASQAKKTCHFLWDLDMLLEDDVPLLSQMIKIVRQLSSAGRIHMSYTGHVYETTDIQDGLRHYDSKAGMVVVPFDEGLTVTVENANTMPVLSSKMETSGIYVIAGAPHGLSGSIGRLLVKNGARNVAFMSRSAGISAEDKKLSAELEAMGAMVMLISVDLTNKEHLSSVAASLMQFPGGVKGIVQCAGVLQDSVFDKMTQDQWNAAIRPKVDGTKNIASAFIAPGADPGSLPWLLMLSSAAGIVGNRGQANYAAANTWQDAFTRELRSRGVVASSLAFGPIMGPGMISRNPAVMQTLKASGFFGIRHSDFLKIVGSAIACGVDGPANSVYGVGTGGLIRQMKVADPYWLHTAIFSHLALVDNAASSHEADDADAAETKEKLDVESVESVQNALSNALAVRLEMVPGSIDVDKSMLSYGLDSFNGFWLRKWVEDNTGVQVLVFEIIGDVTLSALARTIVKRYHEKAKAAV